MANYADGLTDLHLPKLIEFSKYKNKIATLLAVTPRNVFHIVNINESDLVENIRYANEGSLVINAGHFVFKSKIFEYIKEGEELVEEPFRRLIHDQELAAFKYNGFWACMDTFKDKQTLDEIFSRGNAPWEVWEKSPNSGIDKKT